MFALALLAVLGASAEEARPITVAYFGEGGGSLRSTRGVADYLENHGRQASRDAGAPKDPSAAAGRRYGAFVPKDPAARRRDEERARAEQAMKDAPAAPRADPKRYKLWEGVAKPVEVTPAKIGDAEPAEAELAAREEYERRILGAVMPKPPQPSKPEPAVVAEASKPGELFVAVDLEIMDGTELRDAVAGLSGASGFRRDERFPPSLSQSGRRHVSVRGWLPAQRLTEAVQAPGVKRVEIDRELPRRPAGGPTTAVLVGLRVLEGQSAGETALRVIGELAGSSGFRWTSTGGFQALPGTKDVALIVAGEVPITNLSRVLAHPNVLKISPAPAEEAKPAQRPSRLRGFLLYVMEKSPILLLVTLLALLPMFGGALARVLKAFVPYHRR